MKKVLLRVFVFFTYLVLIVALAVCGVALYDRVRKYDELNKSFQDAAQQLQQDKQDREVTIEDLKKQFTDQTNEIARLRTENAELKKKGEELQNYGTISGKIYPVVSAGVKDFSQFQLVCAESINTANSVTCRSVSALQQTYVLSVPAGNYRVYAQIYPQPAADSPLAGVKAYYSEYIKCVQAGDASKCDTKKLTAAVDVKVTAGSDINNIDPIDWR